MISRSLSSGQKKILGAISLVEFFRMLGIFLILPIIALYSEKFTSSGILVGLSVASYEITMALFQLPMGALSDKIGRKNAIIIGLIPFVIGNVMCFQAGNLETLIAGRFIAGAGAISSPAIAWSQEVVGSEKRSTSMAFVGVAIGMAFLVGISFAPLLSSLMGMRNIFLVTAVMGIMSIAVVWIISGGRAPAYHEPYKKNTFTRWRFIVGIISFLVSAAAIMIFYLIQVFSVSRYGSAGYEFIFFAPIIVGGLFAITIGEKYRGNRKGAMLSFPIIAGGIALLFLMNIGGMDPLKLSLILIPYFMGYSLFEITLIPMLTSSLRIGKYGSGIGVFYTMQFLGSAAGAIASGVVIGEDVTRTSLVVALAICILMSIGSFFVFIGAGIGYPDSVPQ